ncbi:unnamed protein product [Gordionus sp. m RMFG-2023]
MSRRKNIIPLSEFGRQPSETLNLPCLVKLIDIPIKYFDSSVYRDPHLFAIIESSIPMFKVKTESRIYSYASEYSNSDQYYSTSPEHYYKRPLTSSHLRQLKKNSIIPSKYDKNSKYEYIKRCTVSVNDFDGWFELLSEDEKSAPGYFTVRELAEKFPDKCLVRSKIQAYKMFKSSEKINDANNNFIEPPYPKVKILTKIFKEGEVLKLVSKHTLSSLTQQLKSYKGFITTSQAFSQLDHNYLKCIDLKGNPWYLPFSSMGHFSPLAKRENISGVHLIKDMIYKFHLPIKVKLVHYPRKVQNRIEQDYETIERKDYSEINKHFPEGTVLRLLSLKREYEFNLYLLGSDSIKRVKIPHSCAMQTLIMPDIDLKKKDIIMSLSPTLWTCLEILYHVNRENLLDTTQQLNITTTESFELYKELPMSNYDINSNNKKLHHQININDRSFSNPENILPDLCLKNKNKFNSKDNISPQIKSNNPFLMSTINSRCKKKLLNININPRWSVSDIKYNPMSFDKKTYSNNNKNDTFNVTVGSSNFNCSDLSYNRSIHSDETHDRHGAFNRSYLTGMSEKSNVQTFIQNIDADYNIAKHLCLLIEELVANDKLDKAFTKSFHRNYGNYTNLLTFISFMS